MLPKSKACRAFFHCSRGATAVEFALVATPFLALLTALLQTSLVLFASRVLDEAVEQASRQILTGRALSMTASDFGQLVCDNAHAMFTCGDIMVNVQSYASFSGANALTPTLTFDSRGNVTNQWAFNVGKANEIVVVQVMYQWPIMLGPLGYNLSTLPNGNRLMVSTAVFKNEPY